MNIKVKDIWLVAKTAKAILVEDRDGNEQWIPLSEIVYSLKTKTNRMTIEIPEWLAKAKNLDYE